MNLNSREYQTLKSLNGIFLICRLFEIQPEVNNIPTIELIQILYDNYEYNSQIKEKVTPEKVKEQNDFLEVILQTNVMSRVKKWLTEKNYISPDSLLMKEMLNRIWFTPIEGSTSVFERTFLAEKYGEASIMGLQNWVYVNHAESKKDVNYMGYMDKLDLGDVSYKFGFLSHRLTRRVRIKRFHLGETN